MTRRPPRRSISGALVIGFTLAVLLAMTFATARSALAQPARPAPQEHAPPASSGGEAEGQESAKAEATRAFERGMKLLGEGALDAALAEFLRSRSLYPARGNTLNAAILLNRLRRFDEALDMFETLVREVPNLSGEDRTLVERQIAELRTRVGTVDVRILEPGATIVVSGRTRGTTPLSTALRVSAGSHLVRIVKDGFVPFEQQIEVAGAQQVVVDGKLAALTRSARLRVIEREARGADVLVDGVVVGKAPWEGRVAVGEHTVALRGDGDLGTQPAGASVRENETTSLTLGLEPLACAAQISPTPAGAAVAIDGVAVGDGVWEGRLRCGPHRVEVAATGFLKADRSMSLEEGSRQRVEIALDRDPESAPWRRANPPHVVLDVVASAAITPSFGGELAGSCTKPCTASIPVGATAMVSGGYQFSSGVGLGVAAGYLVAFQNVKGRDATFYVAPDNTKSIAGVADDSLRLSGLLLGADGWLRRGQTWPVSARLGAGVFLGAMRDERIWTSSKDGVRHDELGAPSFAARYLYVAPEVRLGYRVSKAFELSLGVEATFLFALAAPHYDSAQTYLNGVDSGRGAYGDFGKESLAGNVIAFAQPGIGAAVSFF